MILFTASHVFTLPTLVWKFYTEPGGTSAQLHLDPILSSPNTSACTRVEFWQMRIKEMMRFRRTIGKIDGILMGIFLIALFAFLTLWSYLYNRNPTIKIRKLYIFDTRISFRLNFSLPSSEES